jgi:hypothetical protein
MARKKKGGGWYPGKGISERMDRRQRARQKRRQTRVEGRRKVKQTRIEAKAAGTGKWSPEAIAGRQALIGRGIGAAAAIGGTLAGIPGAGGLAEALTGDDEGAIEEAPATEAAAGGGIPKAWIIGGAVAGGVLLILVIVGVSMSGKKKAA